jgi:hypothetical protein
VHNEFGLVDQSQLRERQRELHACHEQPNTRPSLELLNGLTERLPMKVHLAESDNRI